MFRREHEYFISYVYEKKDGVTGNGNIGLILTHSIKTGNDISKIEKYIIAEKKVENAVIMFFKKLS